jgi:hypothetical protein
MKWIDPVELFLHSLPDQIYSQVFPDWKILPTLNGTDPSLRLLPIQDIPISFTLEKISKLLDFTLTTTLHS